MSSIEDVKKQFKTSLERDEPKKIENKKYFLITLSIVILGIVFNYYYFKNKNDKQQYLPPDLHNILNDGKEEDQDPLFQKF
jgi:hypothetical protein